MNWRYVKDDRHLATRYFMLAETKLTTNVFWHLDVLIALVPWSKVPVMVLA